MVINSSCLNGKKELAIPEQTATGKKSTNPLTADSLPKTIMPTKLVKPQGFKLRPNMVSREAETKLQSGTYQVGWFGLKIKWFVLEQFVVVVNLFLPLALPFHKKRCCPPQLNIESRRKTHHNLRRTSTSEERTKNDGVSEYWQMAH
ncbi:hypothetical protein Tco_1161844 [Tanacetum coccineum]